MGWEKLINPNVVLSLILWWILWLKVFYINPWLLFEHLWGSFIHLIPYLNCCFTGIIDILMGWFNCLATKLYSSVLFCQIYLHLEMAWEFCVKIYHKRTITQLLGYFRAFFPYLSVREDCAKWSRHG